ncbi:MAG: aminotransferase class I/II-fold pyridoxal phosphate-dependent enzyme [Candidatus Gastranaerophilales bacterium]|nr:aminotransferase class I/II-fold pyridoxal phosphate-dependent enzyme [Candidatus Gastranaerophilales bacterium]
MDIIKKQRIKSAYEGEFFRENGHEIVNILADYLNETGKDEKEKMFSSKTPDKIRNIYNSDFSKASEKNFTDIIKDIFKNITPLHHPNYLGHQVSAPLPMSALSDLTMGLLNNSDCVFEMGKAAAGTEKAVIEWMCRKIGYDEKTSNGILTSGGTLGNLTALLAARQDRAGYDIWTKGVDNQKPLCALLSEQSHYSVSRAISIMGLGEENAIKIPCDENFKVKVDELKRLYEKATSEGKNVFAVVVGACSTATGKFDDLESIGKFCNEHNIWFHVDGAHGAPTLLSDKYKHYMKGIERADSVVWDAHKMMMFPALVTGVLFKNAKVSHSTFSQNASYILDRVYDENWFDFGLKTMECTKPFLSLKLYSNLKYFGEKFIGDYIEVMYDLTKEFADVIQKTEDFELATYPESNIICFRYLNDKVEDINEFQNRLRNKLLGEENYYIVKTVLNGKQYLRCTIINPLTEMKHLLNLLDDIRKIAKDA